MIKKYNIVYVPGTWDLFHIGHVRLLRRASKIAKQLIVGVDTDKSVKRDKGEYPIVSYRERTIIIKACRYVDKIIWNNHNVPPVNRLKRWKIEAVVLGSDWKGRYLSGQKEAEKEGIEIVYFPYTEDISTTQIKEKIKEYIEVDFPQGLQQASEIARKLK